MSQGADEFGTDVKVFHSEVSATITLTRVNHLEVQEIVLVINLIEL